MMAGKRPEGNLPESLYRALFEGAADAMLLYDLKNGTILAANERASEMYGFPEEELVGKEIGDLSLYNWVEERVENLAFNEGGHFDSVHLRADGTRITVHLSESIVEHEGERAVLCIARDVTERRRAEVRLQKAEKRYRSLVEHVPAVVYADASDEVSSTLYMSPYIEKMLGFSPEEWMGDGDLFLKVLHPDDRERVLTESIQTNVTGKPFKMEYRLIAKDGRVIWVRDEAVLVQDGNGGRWQGVMMDITNLKELEEQLERRTFHDSLTGLPNRALLSDRLEHALSRRHRLEETVGVLFLDLDNFKVINDALGRGGGDELLVAVARRLRSCLRTEDTVARVGDDEFAILLEDISGVRDAVRVAENIERQLREPFEVSGSRTFVTASVGVAMNSSDGIQPEELLHDASAAMFRAKHKAKGSYEVFDLSMHARVAERLKLETDLRQAIEKGEMRVHYQPKVLLPTGPKSAPRVVGVEALIRWEHPERGLILPENFIPLAEETDLIVPIDNWVLREACRQAREWQEEHQGLEGSLFISVNLSPRQFRRPDLTRMVSEALRDSGLDPHALVLEITETAVMEDIEAAVCTLQQLRDLGVRLSVDDFGTGYSSLSYLKHLPVDFLKIDRSFVNGLDKDSTDLAIVSSTISLAHALGLESVAEGVETAEQLERLRALGCDMAQGFYFAEPLSNGKAGAVLEAGLNGRGIAERAR